MSTFLSSLVLLLPFFLGFCIVGQGGLNRLSAGHWGLAATVMVNNVVFLILGLILFLVERTYGGYLPEFFRNKSGFSVFKPWFLVPGVLGFFIVTGIPLAISRLGAFKGFLGIIAAQLVGGLLWDFIVDGSSVSSTKITGAILAITGAALVFSKA